MLHTARLHTAVFPNYQGHTSLRGNAACFSRFDIISPSSNACPKFKAQSKSILPATKAVSTTKRYHTELRGARTRQFPPITSISHAYCPRSWSFILFTLAYHAMFDTCLRAFLKPLHIFYATRLHLPQLTTFPSQHTAKVSNTRFIVYDLRIVLS